MIRNAIEMCAVAHFRRVPSMPLSLMRETLHEALQNFTLDTARGCSENSCAVTIVTV